ncbi:MAG: terpene cyclase/mutase family protein [Pirellulales bacterium]|nr:terpene cyclase/mutase family protein [Pirellulales bacterium]
MATLPITSEATRESVATLPIGHPATVVPPPLPASYGANDRASVASAAPASAIASVVEPISAGDQPKARRTSLQPDKFDQFAAALRCWWRGVPSWLASLLIHTTALIVLGLIYVAPEHKSSDLEIVAHPTAPSDSLADLDSLTDADVTSLNSTLSTIDSGPMVDIPLNPLADDIDAAAASLDVASLNDALAPQQDLLKTMGVAGGSGEGLGGRSGALKGALLKKGGTDASEAAVARALRWISKHQLPDGGWSFDLQQCPTCRGLCQNSGEYGEARLGATAMALLPFLGSGQTHRQGQYREVVRKGIYYLTTHTKNTGGFLSMHEPKGTMYSHGLGTIALCEAYAMTNDLALKPYAQGAVNFTVYAQDPVGGGWRYEPRQDGDTSVVGWQIMALKSAEMAGLDVPSSVFTRATKFLDSVQSDDGAAYGYVAPANGFPRATSAVGLLCRMYLGWKKDNPGLKRGIAAIAREGPSIPARTNNSADMYYNYYATQVLRHWGGYEFDRWNGKTRDWLIESQSSKGHEAGSWYFDFASHSRAGGRLYCTSMATMMLEVYYRHLPIYGSKAVNDEFSRNE